MSLLIPPRPALKALTGPGAAALAYDVPLWSTARTAQKIAAQALATYHTNEWVRKAELTISSRAGNVEWHLEDDQDEEVTDQSDPKYLMIRDLLEKPQAGLPQEQRQSGVQTRRGLWQITIRHMGVAGTGFWYLDQTDALAGLPLAILYIRPDRMFPVTNKAGNLLGWTLDKSIEEGGTPLELTSVLPFYLDPPDDGHFGIGMIESVGMKASIGPLADRHIAGVLASGGRLAGMLIQKPDAIADDDQWNQFVRDFRGITEDPNAARRLQILKVPAEYVRTAATLQELAVTEIAKMARDDILGLWGVPLSQIGMAPPAGLNSGSTKGFDEAILWQGAIHPRLQSFWETVQYGLLDRFAKLGVKVELVLDEPEYDDDAPLYAKATQAANLPLTNDQRLEIIGMPPFDPKGPLGDFGGQVWLPTTLTQVAGPGFAEKQAADQAAADVQQQAQLAALNAPKQLPSGSIPSKVTEQPSAVVKAVLPRPLAQLRRSVDSTVVGRLKGSVADLLASQKADVVGRLRRLGLDHLKRRKSDTASWWTARTHDAKLADALKPDLETIVSRVAAKTRTTLARGKAVATDPFIESVVERVLTKGAGRVKGINQTTRDAIQQAIADALANAETIDQVIAAVEALPIFDADRAEVIARTESMFAYNDAALGSYAELGVTEVEAIDGDGDEECAARDGQTFSIEEAGNIEDHPNGTLDWVPIIPDEPPQKATVPAPAFSPMSFPTGWPVRTVLDFNELGDIIGSHPEPMSV